MATQNPPPVAPSNSPALRLAGAGSNRTATLLWFALTLQETVTKKDELTSWVKMNIFVTLPGGIGLATSGGVRGCHQGCE
jgi:hypothetical protein